MRSRWMRRSSVLGAWRKRIVSGMAWEVVMYELIKESSARAWACLMRVSSASVSH